MFPNKLHWKYFRWVVSFPEVVSLWHYWGCPRLSFLVLLPLLSCSALLEHSGTLLLVSSDSIEDVRDPLYLQYGCGQHSWHPRISWPRLKHTQELSKALSYHFKKQQKFPYFCQLSHPSACLDSGLDLFFPPLGSRWHSAYFVSQFSFKWISFQMRRFILEKSWLCCSFFFFSTRSQNSEPIHAFPNL